MSEAPLHPRDVYQMDGSQEAEQALLDSLSRGRLHHAWLLVGPEGVGKATFAYRAARRLLGAAPDDDFGLLGSNPNDPVCRQVAGRSHPDLMVLERLVEDGKTKKYIGVDEARRLPDFFSRSPASAPYRVAIIDAVDDMNANAANAVLKTLEEPPARGIVFLVSHAPGRLLPTIRSRCRRLVFSPWDEDRLTDFASLHTDMDRAGATRLAQMAKGAPGRVLDLAANKALELDQLAQDLLRRLPKIDEAELLHITDGFRGNEGAGRFALLMERLADQIHALSVDSALRGEAGPALDRWAMAWERLNSLPPEVEGLNLDRADALWTVMADLRYAAKI
jgi:DNA polymerase III subunit delta'